MSREPNWKERAVAVEFWAVTALVAGSFLAGIYSALKYLLN